MNSAIWREFLPLVFTMSAPDGEEYAQLVREQLEALGYNSASIPENVLREFLQDFEQMDVAGEADAQLDAPLSYPTALSTAEAAGVPALTRPALPASKPSSAKAIKGRASAKPAKSAPKKRPPPMSPASLAAAAAEEVAGDGSIAREQAADGSAFAAADEALDATGEQPASVPAFEPAHWDAMRPKVPSPGAARKSMLRSASAMTAREQQRPHSARGAGAGGGASLGSTQHSSRPSSARASLGLDRVSLTGSMPPPPAPAACVDGFVGGGVIINASSQLFGGLGSQIYGSTPRKAKSDPVSMHAKRMHQWRADTFLGTGKPRIVTVTSSPAPPSTLSSSRRLPNAYVVPTSKRRDDLVWATRQMMRSADPDAGGKTRQPRSKTMHPNRYVPCTENRRDELRWAQRAQMAWVH